MTHSIAVKFRPGSVYITQGVQALLKDGTLTDVAFGKVFKRHITGDWGDVDPEDWETNDHAVEVGSRILSAYDVLPGGKTLWIITEADRAHTTVLLPEEY